LVQIAALKKLLWRHPLHDGNTSWKLTSGGGGAGALLAHVCEVRSLLFHAFLGLTNGRTGPCAFMLRWGRHVNKIESVCVSQWSL